MPPSPDEVTWAILKDTRDQAALARFVARYPNSAFRPQAEAQMAALESNSAGKPGLARTSVSSPTSADFYTFTSALASAGTPWCVDVPGSEYRPGRPLSLFGCAGTPNQIFGFGNRSNLTAGGLCLAGGSRNRNRAPGAGDPVVLAECDGSDHQVWELEPFDDNPSLISLVAPSGLCVTVDGANPAPRAPRGTGRRPVPCGARARRGARPGESAAPAPNP